MQGLFDSSSEDNDDGGRRGSLQVLGRNKLKRLGAKAKGTSKKRPRQHDVCSGGDSGEDTDGNWGGRPREKRKKKKKKQKGPSGGSERPRNDNVKTSSGIGASNGIPRRKPGLPAVPPLQRTRSGRKLKPVLEAGDRVYAAWWPDEDARRSNSESSWYAGRISKVAEVDTGSRYGPSRCYDIEYDDGDELDSVGDAYVMPELDYLLTSQQEENGREWRGVDPQPVLEEDPGEGDEWARMVGWYRAEIDGREWEFSLLSEALRAYDASVVLREGAGTKPSDLNLPDEWEFPAGNNERLSEEDSGESEDETMTVADLRGFVFLSEKNKYRTKIVHRGKRQSLGSYKLASDAALAYDEGLRLLSKDANSDRPNFSCKGDYERMREVEIRQRGVSVDREKVRRSIASKIARVMSKVSEAEDVMPSVSRERREESTVEDEGRRDAPDGQGGGGDAEPPSVASWNDGQEFAATEGGEEAPASEGENEDGKTLNTAIPQGYSDPAGGMSLDTLHDSATTSAASAPNLNNSSGYRCVSYHKRTRKYYAQKAYNKKQYYLGQYELKADAALAHDEAVRKLKIKSPPNFASSIDYERAKRDELRTSGLDTSAALSPAAIASKVKELIEAVGNEDTPDGEGEQKVGGSSNVATPQGDSDASDKMSEDVPPDSSVASPSSADLRKIRKTEHRKVSYKKPTRKHVASIRHNEKQLHLGAYMLKVDAALAYDEAVRHLRLPCKINFASLKDYERAKQKELDKTGLDPCISTSSKAISSKVTELLRGDEEESIAIRRAPDAGEPLNGGFSGCPIKVDAPSKDTSTKSGAAVASTGGQGRKKLSSYAGVYYSKRTQKFFSNILHNGRRMHLGSYALQVDAALARDVAVRHLNLPVRINFESPSLEDYKRAKNAELERLGLAEGVAMSQTAIAAKVTAILEEEKSSNEKTNENEGDSMPVRTQQCNKNSNSVTNGGPPSEQGEISPSSNPSPTGLKNIEAPRYDGVKHYQTSKKYGAVIQHKKKQVYLGLFTLEADAALARDEAVRILRLSLKMNFDSLKNYEQAKDGELERRSLDEGAALTSVAIVSKVTKIFEAEASLKGKRQHDLIDGDSDHDDDVSLSVTSWQSHSSDISENAASPEGIAKSSSETPSKKAKYSNYVGVYYHKHSKRYTPKVTFEKRRIYLGSFASEAGAALAHDEAVRQLRLTSKINFASRKDYELAKKNELERTGFAENIAMCPEAIASKVSDYIGKASVMVDETNASETELIEKGSVAKEIPAVPPAACPEILALNEAMAKKWVTYLPSHFSLNNYQNSIENILLPGSKPSSKVNAVDTTVPSTLLVGYEVSDASLTTKESNGIVTLQKDKKANIPLAKDMKSTSSSTNRNHPSLPSQQIEKSNKKAPPAPTAPSMQLLHTSTRDLKPQSEMNDATVPSTISVGKDFSRAKPIATGTRSDSADASANVPNRSRDVSGMAESQRSNIAELCRKETNKHSAEKTQVAKSVSKQNSGLPLTSDTTEQNKPKDIIVPENGTSKKINALAKETKPAIPSSPRNLVLQLPSNIAARDKLNEAPRAPIKLLEVQLGTNVPDVVSQKANKASSLSERDGDGISTTEESSACSLGLSSTVHSGPCESSLPTSKETAPSAASKSMEHSSTASSVPSTQKNKNHLMKLTSEQAFDLPYPVGCSVWFQFDLASDKFNGQSFRTGEINSVFVDLFSRDVIYEVKPVGADNDQIEMIPEQELSYAPTCPVSVTPLSSENSETDLIGEVLICQIKSKQHIIHAVLYLKESLIKEQERLTKLPEQNQRLLDIISQLDNVQMTRPVLVETQIGKSVSKLKSHDDHAISQRARQLVKKWREIAAEGEKTHIVPSRNRTFALFYSILIIKEGSMGNQFYVEDNVSSERVKYRRPSMGDDENESSNSTITTATGLC